MNQDQYTKEEREYIEKKKAEWKKKRKRKRLIQFFLAWAFVLTLLGVILYGIFVTCQKAYHKMQDTKARTVYVSTGNPASTQAAASSTAIKITTTQKLQDKTGESFDATCFKESVFIGDSRIEAFSLYSGVTNADYYTTSGFAITQLDSAKAATIQKKKYTTYEALSQKQYKTIFLMFGENELGWPNDNSYVTAYQKAITKIHELQPTAKIFVQGTIYVTKAKMASTKSFNNKVISRRNNAIKALATSCNFTYLEVNDILSDSSGALNPKATTDGLHLNMAYTKKWRNFLIEQIAPAKSTETPKIN